ncbi:hypothetical protein BDN70DRAFT_994858 [Pholiota conissans]|uniref:LIM zinc-binding domain-containing protein n=1 Tax=Pholiota conissans TaxID=109636 RepID=A0A9P5YXZ2_9AGAR|nr:hypothetical protein BDN70DRAFT_994858 [Pholiota conissans]
MIASLLSPSSASSTPPAQGRISQLLPTVKCSTCHQPVPLAELGEHTCTAPPPVPSLPKPSITPEAATALLPGRLQGRVAGPSSSSTSPPPRMGPSPPAPTPRGQEHQRIPSSASASRLKINTRAGGGGGTSPTQSSFQPKPSPLARSDSSDTSSPRGKEPAYPFPSGANANAPQSQQQSPLRTRMRTPSNSGSISSVRSRTPSTARQPGAFNDPPPPMRNGSPFSNPSMPMRGGPPPPPPPMGQGMQPQRTASPALSLNPNQNGNNYAPRAPPASAGYINGNTPGGGSNGFPSRPAPPLSAGPFAPNGAPRSMTMNMGAPLPPTIDDRPPAPEEAFVPPAERGIDTKTGGAAGMAGVGRRGFAAAARAAMFTVNPMERGAGTPQPYGRMPGGGGFMDYDDISRSTSTPPFSASAAGGSGSGYASSSYAPGPLSASPLSQGEPRYPSSTSNNNNNNGISNNFNNIKYGSSNRTPSPPTQQNIPPPKSAMPSLNTNMSTTNTTQAAAAAVSPISGRLPFFEKFRGRLPGLGSSSSSTDEPQSPEGGDGMTPSASAATITPSTSKPLPVRTRTPPPSSPTESESEYGGLAYAYSTDYEDNDDDNGGAFNSRKSNSSLSRPAGKTTPIPLSLAASLLERSSSSGDSANAARKGHRPQFGSVSSRSRSSSRTSSLSRERDSGRADIRIGGSGPMTNSVVSGSVRSRSEASGSEYGDEDGDEGLGGSGVRFAGVGARGMSVGSGNANGNGNGNGIGNGISTPQRKASTGTSDGDDIGRARAGSGSAAAIAQALGLSRTPSRDRKVLGGPAIMGRSVSGASSSSGGRSVGASPSKQRVYGGNSSIDNGRGDASSNPNSNSNSNSNSSSNANANLRTLDTTAANNRYHRDLDANDDDDEDEVLGGMMGGAKARRSRTVQGTQSPEAAKKPIKLPVRSLTSPSPKSGMGAGGGFSSTLNAGAASAAGLGSGQGQGQATGQRAAGGGTGQGIGGAATMKKETRRRVRTCRKCAKAIEDGRWVSVDGGGVLCERCWKNMYLPKCRRCNLPIEKAAVSSSDGQLKGKYHKECFNCFTCSKPFPDKTFYVYDGKPLCAYHYHEANDSLCAAALCGQPIEGPCAVSHTGDRYHPEHMTCEYPGYPKCGVRLDEYWEVEGRMLCERHASGRGGDGEGGSGEEGDEEWVQSSRAKKRVTRFIDLAGAGGVGGSGLR